jgi:glutaredoxin
MMDLCLSKKGKNVTGAEQKKMIKIYGTENCSYCEMAKKICEVYKMDYQYNDVGNLMPTDWIKKIGFVPRSVPQIFADDTYLGGYTEFKTYVESL